jgi:hypothetical protein
MDKIQWLTTYPSGKAHTHSADDGQIGWKLHAVLASDEAKLPLKGVRAICGLLPRHGWGLDLFIEDKCFRCTKKLTEEHHEI